MAANELAAPLVAVLFAAGEPLSAVRLAEILECGEGEALVALKKLGDSLERRKSGVVLQSLAGGWRLATRPEYFEYVQRLNERRPRRLSPALMETLAIVAFRQPVTRQDIEAIRGVNADSAVVRLCEMELIAESGRKDVIGRPILYRTTEKFLASFGLDDLESLPPLPDRAPLDAEQLSLLDASEDDDTATE